MAQVLLVIGDGAEVIDTMVPLYRLAEDFEVVKAAPAKRTARKSAAPAPAPARAASPRRSR